MTKPTWLLLCCLIFFCNALKQNATIALESDETNLSVAITYGKYLFYGTNNVPAKIIRIDMDTFSRVDSLTLSTDYIRCAFENGTHGFFATKNGAANAELVVVDLATFQIVNTIPVQRNGYSTTYQMTLNNGIIVNNKAYLASTEGTVFRLNLNNNFNEQFDTGYSNFVAQLSYSTNRYYVSANLPGYLVRISTSPTFTTNGSLNIPSSMATATSYNNYAYIGGQDIILIVDLATMSIAGNVSLAAGTSLRNSASLNENAFFTSYSDVLHYDMSTNTIIHSLSLDTTDIAVATTNSNFAYFGTKNGTVYKIDTNLDCLNAVGGVLPHNQSRYVYLENCTTECALGQITCLFGTLSGNLDYLYTTCSSDCPCNTQFGLIYGQLDVYSSPSVCGGSCDSVVGVLYCENGNLTGDFDYNYLNCSSFNGCACPNAIGGPLNSGQSRYVYPSSSSPCTTNCTVGQITCLNGTLTGDLSYQYLSCAPDNLCTCPTATGVPLNNGESRDVYSFANSNCTTLCQKGKIQCNNGTLTGNINFAYLKCQDCKALTSPINATLNGTNSLVTIYFPASPNITISYSVATNASGNMTVSILFLTVTKLSIEILM